MTSKLSRRTMMRNAFLAGASVFLPMSSHANSGAEDYVQGLSVELLGVAKGGRRGDKALQRRFAGILNRYINIPGIASFALGPAKANLPADEKSMFYELVANYAAALIVWYVADFQGSDFEISGSTEQGKFITISGKIAESGEQLRWRVVGSTGNFRVVDLSVKGVWLSIAMKKMFEDTLRSSKGDFGPLYDRLREAETW